MAADQQPGQNTEGEIITMHTRQQQQHREENYFTLLFSLWRRKCTSIQSTITTHSFLPSFPSTYVATK